MATQTDLQGYLRNDDENLTLAIEEWLAQGDPHKRGQPPTLPANINVYFAMAGSSSFENLGQVPITSLPANAGMLVEAIEALVTKPLGGNPLGTIRVRGAGKGHSASPGLEFRRILSPGDGALQGDGLLRNVNQELSRELRELRAINQQQHATLGTAFVEVTKSFKDLATVRVGTTAAADSSGLGSVLGMLVLLMLTPVLKELMAEEQEGGASDLVNYFREMIRNLVIPNRKGDREKVVIEQPKPKQVTAEGEAGEVGGATVADVVGRARDDAQFRAELGRAVFEDAQLRDTLLKEAGISPALAQMFMKKKVA